MIFLFSGCKSLQWDFKEQGITIQRIGAEDVKISCSDSTKDISNILNQLIQNHAIKNIVFDNGTFSLGNTIFVKRSNITFQGSNKTKLKSIFKEKRNVNLFFINENPDSEEVIKNIHYKDLIFDADYFGFLVMVQFNKVSKFSVVDCEFYNGGKTTRDNTNLPSDWTDAIACSNKSSGLIQGNKVIGMTKVGIYISGGCGEVHVIGNYVDMKNCGVDRPGIGCLGNSVIENNVIKNCSGAGILAQTIEPTDALIRINYDVRPINIRIFKNLIEGCQNGIEFNHSPTYDLKIKNIQKLEPRLSASTIYGNTIINSSFCGVSISNRDEIEVRDNFIHNRPDLRLVCGVRIIGSNKIRVTRNIIENAQQNVFHIYKSNDIFIENNDKGQSSISALYEVELRNDENILNKFRYRGNNFSTVSFTNIDLKTREIHIEY